MKLRIRQIFPHNGSIQPDERVPRGWITPQGGFFPTKEHWTSINSHFRRPDLRSTDSQITDEEAAEAERTAHLAYSLGWISVGHAGKLNAIGHRRTFWSSSHPAVLTLRKLLAETVADSIQIEVQLGDYLPSRGVHEDFEIREYDLDALIKRGWLKPVR